MEIYIVRHGQTDLNLNERIQGTIDQPLNDNGRDQARTMGAKLAGIQFDKVIASPLDRAIETASLISGLSREEIEIEPRIIEVEFGPYEKCKFDKMGPAMTLYWTIPEIFPAPKGVETIRSMVERSQSFLKELEQKGYERVLVVCHGGIIRALKGYLEDKRNGIVWRPRPQNCQVFVYESKAGKHRSLGTL